MGKARKKSYKYSNKNFVSTSSTPPKLHGFPILYSDSPINMKILLTKHQTQKKRPPGRKRTAPSLLDAVPGSNCYQSQSSIIIWPTGDKHDDCGLLIRIEPAISQQGRPWGGLFIAKAPQDIEKRHIRLSSLSHTHCAAKH